MKSARETNKGGREGEKEELLKEGRRNTIAKEKLYRC